jgi:hypothetical protein
MPELVLTDTERRTLANLSIPRPIPNLYHELRVDPYTMEPESEKDLLKLLESLADEGWAMKLGEFEDSAKLAHAMQTSRRAMPLQDEKAKLFSERLKVRGEEWRLKGEQWVLTQAGLEKMHQPVDERPRLTTGELRSLITEQAQYVRHNTDDYHFQGSVFDQREDHGPLAGGVLLDKKTGEPFEGDAGPTLLGVAGHWQGREDRPLPWAHRRGEPEDHPHGRGAVVHGADDPGLHRRRHRHDGGQRLAHPDLHRLRAQERGRGGHGVGGVGVGEQRQRHHVRGVHGRLERHRRLRQLRRAHGEPAAQVRHLRLDHGLDDADAGAVRRRRVHHHGGLTRPCCKRPGTK